MKNVAPRFRKGDTTSFMDLTYIDHLTMRRLVNLPRVMMRHMSYVISVKDHELPYGDWLTMVFRAFVVPLIDKQGEEPKRYDFLEETFLTMCKLKRENGVWWLGTGEKRRRDDEVKEVNNEAPATNEEVNEEEEAQHDFDWDVVHEEAEIQGESGSREKFYDAQVDVEAPADEVPAAPASLADSSTVQKEKAPAGVDPSAPTGTIPDSVFNALKEDFERAWANRIQAELDRAQAENARLLALLQQANAQPKP
ncbi:hypothetical protein Dimus_033404 [Dionaea muscipula]